MWEVFTGGDMPYGNKKNPQVVEDVTRGYRLQKPNHCHECIYITMSSCWDNVSIFCVPTKTSWEIELTFPEHLLLYRYSLHLFPNPGINTVIWESSISRV